MFKMFSSLKVFVVAVFAGLFLMPCSVQAVTLIEDFSDSPFVGEEGEIVFSIVGPGNDQPGNEQFVYQKDDTPAFVGDPSSGSLVVHYDSIRPTTRFSAPLGITVTHEDSFTFGAIMTIKSEGYAPDPNGYMEIAFGLTNAETTGTNRTGNWTAYEANTFDMVEFDYFPNVSLWCGGPWVTQAVFGEGVCMQKLDENGELVLDEDGNPIMVCDCFYNIVFTSDMFSLPLDTPLYVELRYDADTNIITTAISQIAGDGSMTELPVGVPPLDIFFDYDPEVPWAFPIQGGFSADTISISAYEDGWNSPWFPTSLVATVTYDKLFFTTGEEVNLPPVINTVSVSPDELWPPNHKDVPVTVTVDVSDEDDNLESITVVVTDEYGDDQTIDYTVPDGSGGTYDIVVNLEAWRGDGDDLDGRVYAIDVVAKDAEGMTDSTSEWEDALSVLVPHDMGKGKK